MKSINLKNAAPFGVFALGILGAFATTSMQSVKADAIDVPGYVSQPGNPCSIEVNCNTEGSQICRLFYPSGPQAKALDDDSGTSCSQELYRPQN